ncbi:hypothetical protein [Ramlibacter humi]|uniref:DUF1090 family protein n=1 Tax=Ramlibacter humi TaxID=2530451 RepID=A0A4Z0CAX0_9BURK|nr:hypothetical protein [Ramlibacter humi]TFZ08481.1 hypothetical protein EZ216_04805 [Ramlibacter humi]
MKPIAAVFLLLAAAAPAWAQSQQEVAAERARIAAERSHIEAAFTQAQKACYQKFAVSDCIDEARDTRREQLADLRRQEIQLNDAERRRRSAERIKDLDERQSQEKQDQKAQSRGKALADQQTRESRAATKADKAAQAASAAQARAQKAAGKETKDPTLPDAQANASRYDERMKEAQEHRAKVEKKQAESQKPAKAPLPVPQLPLQ